MDELQETIETIIEMDEPETILPTLRRAASRKNGPRWEALTRVLADAEQHLDTILNAKAAGPDFTQPKPEPVNTDGEAKSA
jgi:hypothetical protein